MISILRSNQPIAWGLVFVVLFVIGGAGWAAGSWAWEALLPHAATGVAVAAIVHLLYTRGGFVERADSAASIFTAWFWMAPGMALPADGMSWKTALGLLVMLWAWRPILKIQRQASTAHLAFSAGALTGLAWLLEPALWGAFVGLLLSQLLTRSFQFREVALLLIGLAWPLAMAWTWDWLLANLHLGLWPNLPHLAPSSADLPWAVLGVAAVWLVWGLVEAVRTQSGQGLSTQIVRRNALLMGWTAWGGAVAWDVWTGTGGLSAATWGALAITAGFSGGLMVPEPGRPFDGQKRRRQVVMAAIWVVAGGFWGAVWLSQIAA